MSALWAWTLLLGSLLVPGVLLWAGARMHRRSRTEQSAFRGGAVGFMAGLVVVTVLLVTGPHHWPPDSAARAWGAALAVPILGLGGAALGLLASRR